MHCGGCWRRWWIRDAPDRSHATDSAQVAAPIESASVIHRLDALLIVSFTTLSAFPKSLLSNRTWSHTVLAHRQLAQVNLDHLVFDILIFRSYYPFSMCRYFSSGTSCSLLCPRRLAFNLLDALYFVSYSGKKFAHTGFELTT